MVSDEIAVAEILDSLPYGIVVVDHEDRVCCLNRQASMMLFVSREEWIGSPVVEFTKHLERELGCSGFQSHMAKGAAEPDVLHSREFAVRRGNHMMHLQMDSASLHDHSGTIVGRIFTCRDTSRERAIDQRKTDFIGIAAHELRTPLTSIKGAIDLVLSGFAGDLGPDSRELLVIAQENCTRLGRLVSEILDLSKIEAGKAPLDLKLVDPLIPIENAVRALRSFADQYGVRVVIDSSESRPLILLDKDRVQQIVTNLVSNAIRYSPANEDVQVTVAGNREWLECSVSDRGCGISKEDLPRVFGKFQQFGNSKGGGSGLGLAITKELVNRHNGEIWVDSKPGEGTHFTFCLPVDPSSH